MRQSRCGATGALNWMLWIAVTVAVSSLSPLGTAPAAAQAPLDLSNQVFVRAAMTVLGFDHFAMRCDRRTQSSGDAAAIDRWLAANAVDRVRARIAALEEDAGQRAALQRMRTALAESLNRLDGPPCGLALAVTKTAEAQFATSAPDVLAALNRASSDAATTTLPAPAPAATSSASSPATAAAALPASKPLPAGAPLPLATEIDSFGFDSRAQMGIGGFITMAVYPVVLFRSGDALTDIEYLSTATSLDSSRRSHPSAWTRWRRSGATLELERRDGWKALPFQTVYSTLPPDFRLDGLFQSLSGAGTVAVGGTASVAAWAEYRFFPNGMVVRGQGASGSAEFGDTSVVTRGIPADRRGRYRIDGLTLHVVYDDGREERKILVTDPKDASSVIWLDGVAYTRRKSR